MRLLQNNDVIYIYKNFERDYRGLTECGYCKTMMSFIFTKVLSGSYFRSLTEFSWLATSWSISIRMDLFCPHYRPSTAVFLLPCI